MRLCFELIAHISMLTCRSLAGTLFVIFSILVYHVSMLTVAEADGNVVSFAGHKRQSVGKTESLT